MPVRHARVVSKGGKGQLGISREYRQVLIDSDKKRRAASKVRIAEYNLRLHQAKRRPVRDAKMSTLLRLLDVVSPRTYRPEYEPHVCSVGMLWYPKPHPCEI